jgi:hypothetical protein
MTWQPPEESMLARAPSLAVWGSSNYLVGGATAQDIADMTQTLEHGVSFTPSEGTTRSNSTLFRRFRRSYDRIQTTLPITKDNDGEEIGEISEKAAQQRWYSSLLRQNSRSPRTTQDTTPTNDAPNISTSLAIYELDGTAISLELPGSNTQAVEMSSSSLSRENSGRERTMSPPIPSDPPPRYTSRRDILMNDYTVSVPASVQSDDVPSIRLSPVSTLGEHDNIPRALDYLQQLDEEESPNWPLRDEPYHPQNINERNDHLATNERGS